MLLLAASALAFVICVTVVDASYCEAMNQLYLPEEQFVTQYGKSKNIILYWDSDLTRAAAALLTVTFRYALGYELVQLQQIPHNGSTADVSSNDEKLLEKLELTLVTDLTIRDEYKCDAKNVAPIKLKLHVHIAKHLRLKKQCVNLLKPGSYIDTTRLKDCGFESSTTSVSRIMNIYNLLPDYNMTTVVVAKLLNTSSLQLQYKALSRKNLFQMLRKGDESFLFLDYDMWDEDEDVSVVQLQACFKTDTIIANKIAKETLVKELARQIFDILNSFTPPLKYLKQILELESNVKGIEEAACKWAKSEGYVTVDNLLEKSIPYEIGIFICSVDRDIGDFKNGTLNNIINILGSLIKRQYFNIILQAYFINCTHTKSLVDDLQNFITYHVQPHHIGYVIGGVKDIDDNIIVKNLDTVNLPVLLYDAINVDFNSITSVWLTNGHSLHLALGLKHFIVTKNTAYVTVLTEPTPKAKKNIADLTEIGGLILTNYDVHYHLTLEEAENVLQKIKNKTSSIVFVNTNSVDAATILFAAVRLNMNDDKKITWIVREWSQRDIKLNLKHLTFSFWHENGKEALKNNNWKDFEELWNERKWPPKAMAMTDAVFTLVMGMADVFHEYPEACDYLRSSQVIQQFEKSLIKLSPFRTAYQNLTYKSHSPEEALVYMNQWYNGRRTHLVRYRVNTTAQSVRLDWERPRLAGRFANPTAKRDLAGPPSDQGGNVFLQCYNKLLITAMFFLLKV